MSQQASLSRFTEAQETTYAQALSEMQQGRKRSHWMWFIFPQIQGLGYSSTARFYALQDRQEADAYLQHPVLGPRLIEISSALLAIPGSNVTSIMGTPDDMKLKSSMTLFAVLDKTHPVFQQVLDKFFGGLADQQTLRILQQQS
ncbi:Uncharacterized protein, DUF1810 family [Hymenobacter gelipurpurascens]|uniref:Uncharacterized protein, DUF1810 family n=1 Tax=Hymenobacter gelipurpurascens TaxID=89968 RepID=A0A212UHC7_9BACT|nr:DUF1810 domain-containing protein [Hymenobacter gelipurpurascens]SNC77657.1 Uncharacterized protein, DUF1810 family [Hymenobacter gelipurpurascens]